MNFKASVQRMTVALSLVLIATGVLAAPPTYRLYVDGLACPFCAYGIEKKLGALEGVAIIETNIKDGTVVVTMKDSVALDEAAARQAVKAAGFSLRKLEQVQSAPHDGPAERSK
jgi:mercuric ion binding protein